MRLYLPLALLCMLLVSVGVRGADPEPLPPKVDATALAKRVAELERQLASMQKELVDVRRQLLAQVAAMTPAETVESFKANPKKLFTVEFGVESAGWPDGPVSIDEDPMPPIMADWDGRLPGGGKFTLVLEAKAIRGLGTKDLGVDLLPVQPAGLFDNERLSRLSKHLKGKGVRVTGLVKATRPGERHTDYVIVVDDPANFRIND